MKPRFSNQPTAALTRVEVAVVIAVLAIVAVALILPALAKANRRASKIGCVNDLKHLLSPDGQQKKAFPDGKDFFSVFASSEPSLRLDFAWQLGTEFRLNTYSDSIGPAAASEPLPAFQHCDRTPQHGPETHSSKPLGYPFKCDDGCPDQVGTPVFCGRALGAETPNSIHSEVMS